MRRRNSVPFAMPAYAAARETATISWGYFVLTVVCACVLAAGFFLAAKQHFNTMEYGMKNSKLRRQVDDLETEKRRLLLVREVSLSPAEIKRNAKNLGFRSRGETASVTAKSIAPISVQASNRSTSASRMAAPASTAPKAVKASFPASQAKEPTPENGLKKIVLQKARKDGDDMRLMAAVR